MTLSIDLENRIALVTGGATGLGRASAQALIAAGATVIITGRRATVLEDVADEIGAHAVACDVTDPDAARRLIDSIVHERGRLDILVNGAGCNLRGDSFEYSASDWDKVHAVNSRGLFFTSQAAGRAMRDAHYGKIVNIASISSEIGMPQIAAYCSSKGSVRQITQSLAVEWGKFGIRVNAVEPGWFKTDLTVNLFDNPEWLARVKSRIPLGHPGEPADVANAVVFLACPLSDYITGSMIRIDGGALSA